jgi:hypothetical protein
VIRRCVVRQSRLSRAAISIGDGSQHWQDCDCSLRGVHVARKKPPKLESGWHGRGCVSTLGFIAESQRKAAQRSRQSTSAIEVTEPVAVTTVPKRNVRSSSGNAISQDDSQLGVLVRAKRTSASCRRYFVPAGSRFRRPLVVVSRFPTIRRRWVHDAGASLGCMMPALR